MITAFQIGAFQFTGFQEGASGSGGWWPKYVRSMGQRAREKELADAELEAEAARAIAAREALMRQSRVVLTAKPVITDLSALAARPAPKNDEEMAQFMAIMAMIAGKK